MLLNPTRLRRIYDNEALIDREQDAVTLPELMDTVTAVIFGELDAKPQGKFTSRKPMISSMRRNLQRELVDRLIDLAQPGGDKSAAAKPISNLAMMHLRQLKKEIEGAQGRRGQLWTPIRRRIWKTRKCGSPRRWKRPLFSTPATWRCASSFPFFFQAQPGQACNDPSCSCARGGWNTRRD